MIAVVPRGRAPYDAGTNAPGKGRIMDLLTIGGLAIGLAMDAFAVAIAVGLTLPRLSFRPVFRLSFHFGLFQAVMPIIGWLAGLAVAGWIAAYDHWAAFALLVGIGGKMVWEAATRGQAKKGSDPLDTGDPTPFSPKDPTRGLSLFVLSVATSIDALAVGVTVALEGVTIWFPSVVIGLVAAGMTLLGLTLGRRFGRRLGRAAWLLGALILIAIGTRILIEHLTAS